MRAIDWGGQSATDPRFLNLVKDWIEKDGEVYVMCWFHSAAGTKHAWLLTSFAHFVSSLDSVHGRCSVDVYRHPHFPIRGVVNDELIQKALAQFPEGEAWYLMAFEGREAQGTPCNEYGDESRTALAETLKHHVGKYIVIGPDVHWPVPPDDYPGEWVSAALNDSRLGV